MAIRREIRIYRVAVTVVDMVGDEMITKEAVQFREYLSRKYNTPLSSPTQVFDAGKHDPGKCEHRLFLLHSRCGCMWYECECGYQDDMRVCHMYTGGER